jgi:hypothetical protein
MFGKREAFVRVYGAIFVGMPSSRFYGNAYTTSFDFR